MQLSRGIKFGYKHIYDKYTSNSKCKRELSWSTIVIGIVNTRETQW